MEQIHVTADVTRIETKENPTWRDSATFKTLEALRPWIQWTVVGIALAFGYYTQSLSASAQQAAEFADLKEEVSKQGQTIKTKAEARDREISELKNVMVTKELFEERSRATMQYLQRMEAQNTEILNRLPREPQVR